MSDQHPPPYGDGSQQPSYQPPPAGESFPPPPPGPGIPPPTSGGGFPPPPPTSGGGFPPPPPGGYDPSYGSQPGYGSHPGYGGEPGQPGQPGYAGQPGFPGQPGYGPGQPGYDPGQPGYPPGPPGYDPGQPFGGAPGGPPPVTPPARRGGSPLKIILPILGVVLVLCCIGGVVLFLNLGLGNNAGSAKAGDCLSGKSIDERSDRFQEADLEKVDCGDSGAKYKVVGRVDNKTQAQATEEVCRPFADAELIYWQGKAGQEGTVLCLKKN